MDTACVLVPWFTGKALELEGKSVKAHYLLATAHLNLDHIDEAEVSFRAALALSNTPDTAGYRTSIEQGLYSLYAIRKSAEQAKNDAEDAENRKIIDEMLLEAYRREASQGNEEEASSRHALRTQKVCACICLYIFLFDVCACICAYACASSTSVTLSASICFYVFLFDACVCICFYACRRHRGDACVSICTYTFVFLYVCAWSLPRTCVWCFCVLCVLCVWVCVCARAICIMYTY